MAGWLNWREIEKHNDWGVREKNDATADIWNEHAKGWNDRLLREYEFNRRQVDALDLSPEDTVLDICCGTGALTVFIAPKVKRVTALDYGDKMLRYTKENLEKENISNVDFVQCNWNFVEPGIHFPKHDIAVTRHSPAQGDILKMSRAATKYCYSLWNCYSPNRNLDRQPKGKWIRSDNEKLNYTERPDGRLYGYNVHFNLLYDMGANPTLNYVHDIIEYKADTKDELIELLKTKHVIFETENIDENPVFVNNCTMLEDNTWMYRRKTTMGILGWDPNEIQW